MTEISMLAAEGPSRRGFRIWTDLAIFEVLDPDTGKPVADGEPGHLVCTSLFGNNGGAVPALGIGRYRRHEPGRGR